MPRFQFSLARLLVAMGCFALGGLIGFFSDVPPLPFLTAAVGVFMGGWLTGIGMLLMGVYVVLT